MLTGGFASCTVIDFDVFGSLDVAWVGGGTSGTRLEDWLDPLDTGATSLGGSGLGPSQALEISGPLGGLIGEQLAYDAVSSGCSPDDQPYSWLIDGLRIDTGPSITLAFDEPGQKLLEVSHPSCAEAGLKTITIVTEPQLSIDGPAQTVVGLLTELTAVPIGCPAESDGWSWSVAGIVFTGGPTITVSFPTTGSEVVSVEHPTCPAVGTTVIEVLEAVIFSDGFESGNTSAWAPSSQ